ncbi:hypothetical protein N7497_000030 [Penicillium chrysogenum]|nr:hypothetical protein N7497_000030 [Penicillium chrysogenum]
MPTVLLPASAAAFVPRSSPIVVLNNTIEPWLTATMMRVNRVKRPLNNVRQHTSCLTETLSLPNAIWTLCSLPFPKAPESELKKEPLSDALVKYQMTHIEAYVVHVDTVCQNEVALKLTPETIEALVEYHKDVYSVDAAVSMEDWFGKESQLKKLQEEFAQAANEFVYRTDAQALECLEEDGSGELLCGRSAEAKAAIMSLFVPLRPPLQRISFLTSSVDHGLWLHNPVQPPVTIEVWQFPRPPQVRPALKTPTHICGRTWDRTALNSLLRHSLIANHTLLHRIMCHSAMAMGRLLPLLSLFRFRVCSYSRAAETPLSARYLICD